MVPYLNTIAETPETLKRIIDCVSNDHYDRRASEDRFTLREMVAHLADHEVITLDRIVKAVESDGVHVQGYDVDARAREKKYGERDLHHELEVFANRRRETYEYLSKLDDIDMTKHYVHSDSGPTTVAETVTRMMGHDLYHLHQAAAALSELNSLVV